MLLGFFYKSRAGTSFEDWGVGVAIALPKKFSFAGVGVCPELLVIPIDVRLVYFLKLRFNDKSFLGYCLQVRKIYSCFYTNLRRLSLLSTS
jgi:hypothetical protein